MVSMEDLTIEDAKQFKEIVDAMLLLDDIDPQIKEGIGYIDEFARENGKDFYEMMLNLYVMEEIKDAIKKWEVDKWHMKKKKK
jgi:hypothetical protein